MQFETVNFQTGFEERWKGFLALVFNSFLFGCMVDAAWMALPVMVALVSGWGVWLARTPVWRWWRRRELAWEAEQLAFRRMPESVREGSPFMTTVRPRFVAGIYGILRGRTEKILVATAWRYGNWLVTAGHAIHDTSFEEMVIEAGGTYFKSPEWTDIGPDVSICQYQNEWGMKSAKIDSVDKPVHAQVFAAVVGQNSSFGVLKHAPEVARGFVVYEGSTRPTFSGAPYYNGLRVLGMHLGGGVANYGYSASYIDMLIRRFRRPESSELEFIRRILRSARRSEFEYDRQLDETYVRVGGRYMVIDNDEFDEILFDEEFEELFFEFEETDEKQERRKKRLRTRRWANEDEEEPDYEDEKVVLGAIVEQAEEAVPEVPEDFLESPPVLNGGGMDQATVQSLINTSLTHVTTMLREEILFGQTEVQAKLEEASKSMLLNVSIQIEDMRKSLEENLSLQSGQCCQKTLSDFESRFSLEMNSLKTTLDSLSEHLTPRVQQVLESSADSPPSVTHWDGMESDLQKFREWRGSAAVLSPDYAHLRASFLSQLGLNKDQQKALIARFQNRQRSEKRKVAKQRATRSNSS
nr:hypothetical protein 1 [Hypera postica associated sobemovirus 2]